MAKKKDNVVLDDNFDFDEMQEFDFSLLDPEIKDDRKPIIKVASGAKIGAKNHLRSPAFLKETLRNTFPRSFGQALDLSDKVGESVKNLYDDSVAEIKPTLALARKTVSKLIPPDASVVPKKVQEVLQRWRDEPEEGSTSQPSQESIREALLGTTLKEIFEAQQVSDQQRAATEMGRANMQLGLDTVRHRSQLDILNRSAISLKRLDDYTTSTGLSFQRKSLELQYRTLFTLQDQLDFAKMGSARRNEFLASIAKNTGLPEFAKVQTGEVGKDLRRKKLFDMYHNAIFGVGDQFIQDGIEKMKRSFVEGSRNAMQDFRGALQVGDMAADMTQGMPGFDAAGQAGQALGRKGAQFAGNTIAEAVYNKLKGSKLDEKVGLTDTFQRLDTKLTNLPNAINEFRNDRSTMYDTGLKANVLNFLRGVIPSLAGDKALVPTTSKDLFGAGTFTNHTNRSITEIIPGYLSRILREVQVFRTGKEDIELTDFSHDRGTFMDRGQLISGIDRKLTPDRNLRWTRDSLNDLATQVDPKKEMSQEERQALKKRLLHNSADRNLPTAERLAKPEAYEGESAEIAKAVAKRMDDFLAKLTEEQRTQFSNKHNRLVEGLSDPRQLLQDLLETGHIDHLRSSNLVVEKGADIKVNIDEILRRYLDENFIAPSGPIEPKTPTASEQLVRDLGRHASSAGASVKSTLSGLVPTIAATKAGQMGQQAASKLGAFGGQISGYAKPKIQGAISGLQMPKVPKASELPSMAKEQLDVLRRMADTLAQRAQPFSSKAVSLISPKQMAQAEQVVASQQQKAQEVAAPAQQMTTSTLTEAAPVVEQDSLAQQTQSAPTSALPATPEVSGQQKAMEGLAKLIEGFSTAATSLAANARSKVQRITPTLKQAASQVRGYTAQKRDQLVRSKSAHDLYVIGESVPRMLAIKLEQGKYFLRETGRAIRSMSDVKGTVVDEDDNVVVMAQEVPNLAYVDDNSNVLTRLFSRSMGLMDVVKELGSEAKQGTLALTRAAMEGGAAVLNRAMPADVYVEGESEPRLLAVRMLRGHYSDAESGKTITSPEDVTGPVIDNEGRTVIAKEEVSRLRIFNLQIRAFSPLGAARALGRAAWHYQTKIAPKWAMWNLRQLGRLTKFVGGGLIRGVGRAMGLKMADPPRDVYVAGEASPRLEASRFAKGEYLDRDTGAALRSEQDIKGPVIDRNGVTLIDADDLPNLVVYNSRLSRFSPLRLLKLLTLPFKALGWLAKKAIAPGLKMTANLTSKFAPKVLKTAGSLASGAAKAAGWALGVRRQAVAVGPSARDNSELAGKAKPPGLFAQMKNSIMGDKIRQPLAGMTAPEVATVKSSSTLDKILEAVRGMTSKKPASPAERKGGYLDRLTQRKTLKENEKTWREQIAARLARTSKKKTDEKKDDDDEGLLDMLGKLKTVRSVLGGIAKAAVGLGGMLGLGKLAGAAAGAGALASGAGAAAAGAGAVAAGGTAATAATGAAAAAATTTAAVTGGAGVLGTLGAIAAGIGSVISAPVVLAVAATAAIGYAGYRGLKYMNRGYVDAVGRTRMTQYGFFGHDTENIAKLIDLEDYLAPFVLTLPNRLDLDYKNPKFDPLRIVRIFGLDPVNPEQRALVANWFQQRFKPVFLTHLLVLRSITGKASLDQIDELDDEKMDRYLSETRFSEGPYGYAALPVLGDKLKATTAQDVDSAFTEAQRVLLKRRQAKAERNKRGQRVAQALPIGGAAAAALPTAADAAATKKPADSLSQHKRFGVTVEQASSPDAEPPPSTTVVGAEQLPDKPAGKSSGNLPVADGDPKEGRSGLTYISMGRNVKLDGLNPQMRQQLLGMIEEYGTATGKKVPITDGHRTYDDQVRARQRHGAKAAMPGTSIHELGLAVDMDSKTIDEMERLGLMRKYGFTRPVGGEAWHVEPIGIQDNLDLYRKNPEAATQAVAAGLGRGGSGLGSDRSTKLNTRSRENSLSILQASSEVVRAREQASGSKDLFSTESNNVANADSSSALNVAAGYGGPAAALRANNVLTAPKSTAQAVDRSGGRGPAPAYTAASSLDSEIVPDPKSATAVARPRMNGISPAFRDGPANPGVKIPDPKGAGVDGMRETVLAAAKMVGADPQVTMQLVAMESGFNPNARAGGKNGKTSSAAGLGQFTAATWREYMTKYASKYGLDPNTPPTDPKASAIMTAQYLKDNMSSLSRKTNQPVGMTEAYLAHFLGPGGAGTFLNAKREAPDSPAAAALPSAAESNRSIFYEGARARSIAEVYTLLDNRIREKSKAYGIELPQAASVSTAKTMDVGAQPSPSYIPATTTQGAKAISTPTPVASAARVPMPMPMPGMPQVAPRSGPAFIPTMPAPAVVSPRSQPMEGVKRIGGMDASLFAKTETLLDEQVKLTRESVTVQTDMRDLLKAFTAIFTPEKLMEIIKASVPAPITAPAAAAASSAKDTYQVPEAPISMRRNNRA